jgi:hypothetical protein
MFQEKKPKKKIDCVGNIIPYPENFGENII